MKAFLFDDLKQLIAGRRANNGTIDLACPFCGPHARAPANRTRRVLRVWDDEDFISYNCARCGESGWAKDDRQPVAERRNATAPRAEKPPLPDKSELARFLWSQSRPIAGTAAEVYLRSRRCFVPSPALRFLPRGSHPPAMIARFGDDEIVSGVHLTRLKPDGSGKATFDDPDQNAKIIIGPCAGQPIIVADNPDRGEVIVAEGIEDAATLHTVTGWSAWAAGALTRMAAVVKCASNFETVYVAFDEDINWPSKCQKSLRQAATARRVYAAATEACPHLIPVRFGRGNDANKTMMKHRAEAVLATIEWCEAKARYRRRDISFGAMERAMERANGCFAREELQVAGAWRQADG